MRPTVVLGIDIGGSTTRMLVAAGGRVIDSVRLPSAGLNAVGVDGAREVFEDLAARVESECVAAVCAGSAGVDDEASRTQLHAVVQRCFPSVPVRVLHDADLVLAAAGEESGIVLISGTGSVAWARDAQGCVFRAGGWGPLLGDEGSGYVIALDAVRAVLDETDRAVPQTALAAVVLEHTGVRDPRSLSRLVHLEPDRAYWARLAEPVLALADSGDTGARAIVDTAVRGLVRIAQRTSETSGMRGPVLLAGGVLGHARALADAVTAELTAAGLEPVRVVEQSPAHGAMRLAERMLREGGPSAPEGAVGEPKQQHENSKAEL
ncbi:N-acetylglucosamine kinase [Nocardia sp. NPDC058499]|uniref:N-acetylglucosamine kinase n=1 Tax=Nocardia sp. NPDC058499 TaxID=3346530 RepID=UPI003658EF3B